MVHFVKSCNLSVKDIIIKTFHQYPDPTFWLMTSYVLKHKSITYLDEIRTLSACLTKFIVFSLQQPEIHRHKLQLTNAYCLGAVLLNYTWEGGCSLTNPKEAFELDKKNLTYQILVSFATCSHTHWHISKGDAYICQKNLVHLAILIS